MKDYLSYSQLKAFAKSPNHYLAYLAQEFEQTPQMVLGSAIHCKVLEPETYEDRYVVAPKVDRRTKEGKAQAEAFEATLGDRTALSVETWEQVAKVTDAVRDTRWASSLLHGTQMFEDVRMGAIAGFRFKAVADMVGDSWIADLKTTSDASPEAFMRQAYNLDYHLQAAIYCELYNLPRFFWIVAETSAPYNVQVYQQSEEAANASRTRMYKLLEEFKNWDGEPAGYSQKCLTLDLPRWA